MTVIPYVHSEKAGRDYYVVDAFADSANFGTGNPAAVVLLEKEPTTDQVTWMQTVAQEFNLSETAFIWKLIDATTCDSDTSVSHYGIRYFTPTMEVDLCGHATLASAAVLTEIKRETNIVFHAPNDVLLCASKVSLSHSTPRCTRIAMSFPITPVRQITNDDDCRDVETMMQAAFAIRKSDILFMGLVDGLGDVLIEVRRDAFIYAPHQHCFNVDAFLAWEGYRRGVIVCCEGGEEVTDPNRMVNGHDKRVEDSEKIDFCSRFFAPKAGIVEDPVTGSAHCALAPYFGAKLSKKKLLGKQLSPRGGIVACDLSEDMKHATLTGTAITTASGTLWI
jgi:predicted PhzF superfamily epimerase YddE/YHI9